MPAGLEVADVFRRHGDAYRRAHDGHIGRVERRVMGAIEACRTATLGGHAEAYPACGLVRCAYNSCRNRHCPKCQGAARAEWLAARQADLLPVPYFHVLFTLPAPVAEIAFQNKAVVYAILFKAAAETLRQQPSPMAKQRGRSPSSNSSNARCTVAGSSTCSRPRHRRRMIWPSPKLRQSQGSVLIDIRLQNTGIAPIWAGKMAKLQLSSI
ncbi:transposase-like zinc-binding protein [Nitrospirillum amazonense]|uniref:Transposase-like zinc-binding protein n=1 Tax=Nitrospirillum amazonense TaxID=28077 RepID=A0A560EUN3_9PROT|nr:transposase-like zinc-binding protein [Nitrospirillum amazonense]